MSRSRFAAAVGSSLVALYIAVAASGIGVATSADGGDPPPPPPPPTTEGNPWHG